MDFVWMCHILWEFLHVVHPCLELVFLLIFAYPNSFQLFCPKRSSVISFYDFHCPLDQITYFQINSSLFLKIYLCKQMRVKSLKKIFLMNSNHVKL